MIPEACLLQAAHAYHVPVAEIQTVISSPRPSDAIGVMGIPPAWLTTLARFGFDPDQVSYNDCENIRAGVWILAANPASRVVPAPRDSPATPAAPINLPACAVDAADAYRVPLQTVYKILEAPRTSGGAGPMKIPLSWLPTLAHYGFNPYLVQHDVCMGLVAGEWILGLEQMQGGEGGDERYPVNINATLSPPPWVLPIAEAAAKEHHLPLALLLAFAAQESGFHTGLTSSAGAKGLMQLMPATAFSNGVTNPFDPIQSMDGGANYISSLYTEFDGNLPLVIAAYDAGDQAVVDYGHKIPPYKETEQYVPDVLSRFHFYTTAIAQGRIEISITHQPVRPAASISPISVWPKSGVLVREQGLAAKGIQLAFSP